MINDLSILQIKRSAKFAGIGKYHIAIQIVKIVDQQQQKPERRNRQSAQLSFIV